ncbi:ferredoxin [Pseudonocardia sp. RS11V-5]|uniref:ferredoxin n=1 Tax=Pseudonocardia terrae TaxID=2905831 RepID=UPI001E614F42|nr:ferredoxin [Pseudonocardia terrae]MCE3554204.1 ferredoxin [Pseudonocardia terrae]
MTHRSVGQRVRLDPIACTGHGLCADLVPELVTLDEWGYPRLQHGRTSGPVDADTLPLVREAVTACPTLALRMEPAPLE